MIEGNRKRQRIEERLNEIDFQQQQKGTIKAVICPPEDEQKYPSYLLHSKVFVGSAKFDPLLVKLTNANYTLQLLKGVFASQGEFIKYLEEDDKRTAEQIQANYTFCLHLFFKIFAEPDFTDSEQAIKVLEFLLVERKLEEIIEEKGNLGIVHWLTFVNNYEVLNWAFNYYSSIDNENSLEKIFTATDDGDSDIFDYLADGIAGRQIVHCEQETKTINLVLEKYQYFLTSKLGSGQKKSEEIKNVIDQQKEWLLTELERQDYPLSKYLSTALQIR